MADDPFTLNKDDADTLIAQYQETARIRDWAILAASVMYNHTHIVVGVPGDPEPSLILETFKSWATRALKKWRKVPKKGTFWTANGSKRKLPNDEALLAGIVYVPKKQPNPLAVYVSEEWQEIIAVINPE